MNVILSSLSRNEGSVRGQTAVVGGNRDCSPVYEMTFILLQKKTLIYTTEYYGEKDKVVLCVD